MICFGKRLHLTYLPVIVLCPLKLESRFQWKKFSYVTLLHKVMARITKKNSTTLCFCNVIALKSVGLITLHVLVTWPYSCHKIQSLRYCLWPNHKLCCLTLTLLLYISCSGCFLYSFSSIACVICFSKVCKFLNWGLRFVIKEPVKLLLLI